jgi:2-methylisocitrate lyase-like PEP mutase family enzyme
MKASVGILPKPKKSTRLRDLFEQPGPIVIPSVYDCVSLRIVEKVGFKVAADGGFNTAASTLGLPDIGLLTMSETVDRARNMAAVSDIPLLWDADDCYGDINNVMRTTREFIRSGIAAMLIEDQVSPKRCPALGGGDVISTEDMILKLRAVNRVRAEEDPDFVVVARTHASRAIDLEEGLARGIAYAKEGADVIFVDQGYDEKVVEELKIIAEKIAPYAHLMANMTETVGRPLLTNEELYKMGFKVIIYSLAALMSAAAGVAAVMKELFEKGTTRTMVERMMPVSELGRLLGIDEIRKVENEFGIAR